MPSSSGEDLRGQPKPVRLGRRLRSVEVNQPRLALYHYDACGYCQIVRSDLADSGLEVELRNIHQVSEHRDALMAAMGRTTVPVLRIEDADGSVRWLPESADIVRYLRKLTGRPEPALISGESILRVLPWLLLVVGLVAGDPYKTPIIGVGIALIALRFALRLRQRPPG